MRIGIHRSTGPSPMPATRGRIVESRLVLAGSCVCGPGRTTTQRSRAHVCPLAYPPKAKSARPGAGAPTRNGDVRGGQSPLYFVRGKNNETGTGCGGITPPGREQCPLSHPTKFSLDEAVQGKCKYNVVVGRRGYTISDFIDSIARVTRPTPLVYFIVQALKSGFITDASLVVNRHQRARHCACFPSSRYHCEAVVLFS